MMMRYGATDYTSPTYSIYIGEIIMTLYQFLFLAVMMAASFVGMYLLNKIKVKDVKNDRVGLIMILIPFILLAILFVGCVLTLLVGALDKMHSLYVYVGTL